MGLISSPVAHHGLTAVGTPTKTNSNGATILGVSPRSLALTGSTVAYTISATLASSTQTLTINTSTGVAAIGTTPVAQVETATVVAASGATSNGNLAVTVTGARITGSPLAISVALTTATHTTATLIAGAIRTAFNANTALTAIYTVGGSGADITLTEIDPENNDATLNIAIAAGLGVSAIVSSTNTTSGVGGVKLTNNTGDGLDFEGIDMGTILSNYAILCRVISGEVAIDYAAGVYAATLATGGFVHFADLNGTMGSDSLVVTASAASEVEITFVAVT